MPKLPKHVIQDLKDNKTSLGDHPAFPPEQEEKFIVALLGEKYTEVSEGIDTSDVNKLKTELARLVKECMTIEENSSTALEQLCLNVVTKIFDIPQDTIEIECHLVSKVDVSAHRFVPEKTPDFSFDNMDDLRQLTDDVYKRRFLDALVAGAANYYATDISLYLEDLYAINTDLPSLYAKINKLNGVLLYLGKNTMNQDATSAGKVDVNMGSQDVKVKILSEGMIFPALLEETIKGLFEVAIAHGLPKELKKAQYVMKKADFRLAEVWDLRLGLALWERIVGQTDGDISSNFFLMELAQLPTDNFNDTMQEILLGTREGKRRLENILTAIERNRGEDDFNDYLKQQNDKYPIEDGYFTEDELLTDDLD